MCLLSATTVSRLQNAMSAPWIRCLTGLKTSSGSGRPTKVSPTSTMLTSLVMVPLLKNDRALNDLARHLGINRHLAPCHDFIAGVLALFAARKQPETFLLHWQRLVDAQTGAMP